MSLRGETRSQRPLSLANVRRALSLLVVLGCGARPELPSASQSASASAAPSRAATESFDGALRLDESVVPRHYTLDLTIDPASQALTGTVTILVEARQKTQELRLHAEGMSFEQVSFRAAGGGPWERAVVSESPNGGISLSLGRTLEPGSVELFLRYRAPLLEAPNGVYRAQDQGSWYVFTQFEPLEARRAFPCFDQPSFKAPFRVTLRVPDGNTALANAPELSSALEGTSRVFQFAETQPLPTYLVAFAVGPFDIRNAKAGTRPEQRIVTTRGKGGFADQSLAWTPRILLELTDYFQAPYPFQKLDQVAVPNFAAGAMENVGLVTYRESLLLVDARAPAQDRWSSQSVIAHELSHMWFGNLVTVPWWDDIWLNESFATWMAPKVLGEVSPELEALLARVTDAQRVMALDSRRDARSIRQPVREQGDIYNAFDGITYAKGAAVLSMLEAWVGPEPFRAGLQQYMREHAYGSGTTSDVLSSLERASGKPVARVARGFLDQPGTPNISFEIDCSRVPSQPNRVTLTQSRYLPAGSSAPQGSPWSVPVCFRHGDTSHPDVAESRSQRQCVLFEGKTQTFPLESGCPTWLVPNAGALGYYRWQLPPEAIKALAAERRGELELAELIALPGDLGALVEAEAMPAEDYLAALTSIATESHPMVVGAVVQELERIYDTAIDDQLAAGFAGWVRALLEPQRRKLGNAATEGEPVTRSLLRPRLLAALATWGRDPALYAFAKAKVDAYLREPASVSSEELANFLPSVTLTGDAELWEALRARLRVLNNPSERRLIVSGLGHFESEALVLQSLDLVLDGQLRGQDFRPLVGAMPKAVRLAALTWLVAHYDGLIERIGDKAAPRLPDIGVGLCTEAGRAQLERSFRSLAQPPSGLDRNLSLVLEGVERCIRRREYLRPALQARLASKR